MVESYSNDLTINPNSISKYVVQVVGLDSCSYEISYTTLREKIFEMVDGHHFLVNLFRREKMYFVYFHARKESFRMVTLVEHGSIAYRIKNLRKANLSDIPKVVADAKKTEKW